MRKILRMFLVLALAGTLLFALSAPGSAVNSADCGLKLTKNDNYSKDGYDYRSFTIQTGRYPGSYGSADKTKVLIELYNAAGKRVVDWGENVYGPNTKITRNPGYNYNKNLSSGVYTMKVTVTLVGEKWSGYGYVQDSLVFVWSYNINHTQAAIVNLSNVEVVRRDDGSYTNKFIFSHSGAKGQVLNMEIYDPWGSRVYSTKGSPISYTSGTYSFTWGGYPSGGGVQCGSGTYTIKYWLDGKNAKQSRQYLSIY